MNNLPMILVAIFLVLVIADGIRRAWNRYRENQGFKRRIAEEMSSGQEGYEPDPLLDLGITAVRSRSRDELGAEVEAEVEDTVAEEPAVLQEEPMPVADQLAGSLDEAAAETVLEEPLAESEPAMAAENFDSSLPGGGARVVGRRDREDAQKINKQVQQSYQSSRQLVGQRRPQQATLNLEEQVPTLMESVAGEGRVEPSIDDIAPLEELQAAPVSPERVSARPAVSKPEKTERVAKAAAPETRSNAGPAQQDVQEVLIVNVVANAGDQFEGNDLLRIVLSSGMRLGDRDIFHRHEDEDGAGPVQFSMANMVVPGTFNLASMEEFYTPGVSLFMTLPMASDPLQSLNRMLQTANHLANQLGGALRDENRSVFTAQMAEHYRQRVIEFQRRQRIAKN
ncbi:cell division protein ZipA [Biformimicrobium ophioploci]|uniref:Cell division protein ZipA n=1 Tax=Biformimicrobium ophioploci TaxID=3036711 RepID=A0ABQ6LZZ9_9GAMM|nr:cell division protein ZipA [Microbulbifer sp. NKW57]GMG87660.1 hypothetical protein MNKW57_19810 [Microbulbifer sp. NKW57]